MRCSRDHVPPPSPRRARRSRRGSPAAQIPVTRLSHPRSNCNARLPSPPLAPLISTRLPAAFDALRPVAATASHIVVKEYGSTASEGRGSGPEAAMSCSCGTTTCDACAPPLRPVPTSPNTRCCGANRDTPAPTASNDAREIVAEHDRERRGALEPEQAPSIAGGALDVDRVHRRRLDAHQHMPRAGAGNVAGSDRELRRLRPGGTGQLTSLVVREGIGLGHGDWRLRSTKRGMAAAW